MPDAVGNGVRLVNQMPLSRAVFFQHAAVGMAAGDERGSGWGSDGRRQPVGAVGIRGRSAQSVRLGNDAPQQVVFRALHGRHGSRVRAGLQNVPLGVPRVACDGFRRNDGFPVRHRAADDFHQLPRAVVAVGRGNTIFIRFAQQVAAAHVGARGDAPVAARSPGPAVLLVKFVVGGGKEPPCARAVQDVTFLADCVAFRCDIADVARGLAGDGSPFHARFRRDIIERAVIGRSGVVVPGLNAVGPLGHARASPGMDIFCAPLPGFRDFQSRRAVGSTALFYSLDVVGGSVGIGFPEM